MGPNFVGFVRGASRFALLAALAACGQSSPGSGDDSVTGGSGTDNMGAAGDTSSGSGGSVSATTGMGGGGNGTAGTGTSQAGASGAGGSSVMVPVEAGPIARMGKLKIMPLGDSVTCCTCYRAELAKLLDKSHPSDYQFIGTINNDYFGCGGYNYDKHNQGMGGYLVTETAPSIANGVATPTKHTAEVAAWTALAPDVILLHFATNDSWNTIPVTKILAAYTWMVNEFRKTNPRVTVLAAQLIPLDPFDADGGANHSCTLCPVNVKNLNAAIPGWVKTTDTPESRVLLVDQWTGYDATADSRDGVHPGPSGSVKMANKWDQVLEPLF
jgi:hypothetical protein